MDKIEKILDSLPDEYNTSLDSQIAYIEAANMMFANPISIAIAASLKELRGIKKSQVEKLSQKNA